MNEKYELIDCININFSKSVENSLLNKLILYYVKNLKYN